jgi:FkbM family methyltransferase
MINSWIKRLLRLPFVYQVVRHTFLHRIKKIRRAVWLPEYVKVRDSQIIIRKGTTPKIADLHFLGWHSLKDYYYLSIMKKLALRSEIIFDVGADIGMVSLYISEGNPAARIFSFEPSKHSFPILLNTVKTNKNLSIIPLKLAVSAKSSVESFYYSPENSVVSSLKPRPGFIEELVAVTSIEDFCVQNNLDKIDLLKIDVEGFESQVIAGLGEQITNSRPMIFAEVLSEANGMKIRPVLPENYRCYRIIEETMKLKEDDRIDRTSKLSNNYLLMPSEKSSMLEEFSLI